MTLVLIEKDLVLNGSRKQTGDKQVPGMYLHIQFDIIL